MKLFVSLSKKDTIESDVTVIVKLVSDWVYKDILNKSPKSLGSWFSSQGEAIDKELVRIGSKALSPDKEIGYRSINVTGKQARSLFAKKSKYKPSSRYASWATNALITGRFVSGDFAIVYEATIPKKNVVLNLDKFSTFLYKNYYSDVGTRLLQDLDAEDEVITREKGITGKPVGLFTNDLRIIEEVEERTGEELEEDEFNGLSYIEFRDLTEENLQHL